MLSDLQLVYMGPRNSTQLLKINTTKFQVKHEPCLYAAYTFQFQAFNYRSIKCISTSTVLYISVKNNQKLVIYSFSTKIIYVFLFKNRLPFALLTSFLNLNLRFLVNNAKIHNNATKILIIISNFS